MLKNAAVIAAAAVVSALGAGGAVVALDSVYDLPRVSIPFAAPLVSVEEQATASAEPMIETAAPSSAAAAITKAKDGHFWAEATVEGRHVRFLVDTGATTVALTAADAKRLGIDASRLDFSHPVKTAAGEIRAALVELDYVSVAGARVEKVQALVMEKGLETSLLGMSYLGRLSRLEATPDSMILRS
ncbi:TIGR02281 family clan AA aspartic protease [Caulobacter sp. 17J80-11]|uniref:TIGR02281 family clan AA aspartic protease n=1 Tax=Caulobacter sp. 17J80-11 TaxID=2763502 RepID=UPI00165360C9|nr:TIGR02281 family clan AA aspartic protease [Caulobacter sp. 17J80-11]MBC6980987.1 TIGR02281 family clan AA aspartic protease [Caulobacter sp. 17J80-11]